MIMTMKDTQKSIKTHATIHNSRSNSLAYTISCKNGSKPESETNLSFSIEEIIYARQI